MEQTYVQIKIQCKLVQTFIRDYKEDDTGDRLLGQ